MQWCDCCTKLCRSACPDTFHQNVRNLHQHSSESSLHFINTENGSGTTTVPYCYGKRAQILKYLNYPLECTILFDLCIEHDMVLGSLIIFLIVIFFNGLISSVECTPYSILVQCRKQCLRSWHRNSVYVALVQCSLVLRGKIVPSKWNGAQSLVVYLKKKKVKTLSLWMLKLQHMWQ